MKVTKFVHSCLLVEAEGRTALFDPGSMSVEALKVENLSRLDDIFITHIHQDHCDISLVQELVTAFPEVRITSTPEVVEHLQAAGIRAGSEATEGVQFFDAPHESVKPLFPQPEEIGIHYLDMLSDPGDSHSFHETKAVLALPITAPWGSTIKALNITLELKPKHVLPIHDWHWSDIAREQMYDMFENQLASAGIKFHKLQTGEAIEVDV